MSRELCAVSQKFFDPCVLCLTDPQESHRTTSPYDRRSREVELDEIERVRTRENNRGAMAKENELSDRVLQALRESGYDTPEKILFSYPHRLMRIRGIGPKTLAMIAKTYPIFLMSSLKKQTEFLQIPLHIMLACRSGNYWYFDESIRYERPEKMVLEHFRALGWEGDAREGYPFRLIELAACQGYINRKTKQKLDPHNLMFMEKYLWLACKLGTARELVEPSATIADTELRENLLLITENHRFVGTYGDSIRDINFLMQYWNNLGRERFRRTLEMQTTEEGKAKYYTGWPDITLVKGRDLKHVEVKTTDRIHESQMETIRELLIPLGIPVEIFQVKCSRAKGAEG